jgi:hypothetical protein
MEFWREYGVATHIRIPIPKRGVVDFAVGADWTPAAGDVKIDKDGGGANNVTNLPAATAMGNTAYWDFSLTATEMQAAQIVVTVSDSATKAVEDQSFLICMYGNASARHKLNFNDTVRAGLTALPNAAAEAAGGLFTRGSGAGQINQNANGQVDSRWVAGNVTVGTNSDKTGYTLSSAGIQGIFDCATSLLTTAGSIGKRIVDFLTGDAYARLGAPAGASTAADIAAVLAKTPDASHYTNARGDKLDNLDAAITTRSTLGGTAQTGDVYGLLTSAQAEPAGVPAANATPMQKWAFMFASIRNRRTTTSTQDKIYADDASTVIATGALSDDGTTFERGEYA